MADTNNLSYWIEMGWISAADANTLTAALNPAERPAPTGVVFCGATGMGKSALLGALLRESQRPYLLIETRGQFSELTAVSGANCVESVVLSSGGVGEWPPREAEAILDDMEWPPLVGAGAQAITRQQQQYPNGLLVLDRIDWWGPSARLLAVRAQVGGWSVALLCTTPAQCPPRTPDALTAYVAECLELPVAHVHAVVTHYVLVEVVAHQPQVTLYTVGQTDATDGRGNEGGGAVVFEPDV